MAETADNNIADTDEGQAKTEEERRCDKDRRGRDRRKFAREHPGSDKRTGGDRRKEDRRDSDG